MKKPKKMYGFGEPGLLRFGSCLWCGKIGDLTQDRICSTLCHAHLLHSEDCIFLWELGIEALSQEEFKSWVKS